MPGEVEQATLDVSAADADRRLDQMSVITLTGHAWELTSRACLQMGTGSECSPGAVLPIRVTRRCLRGMWDGTVVSSSGQTERTDTVFDVG